MLSQPYVDGITDTVTHDLASSLTVGQIAVGGSRLTVSVICPDRWFHGDLAVVTSRDGHAFAGTPPPRVRRDPVPRESPRQIPAA